MTTENKDVWRWFWIQWLLANVLGTVVYLRWGLFTEDWTWRTLILVPGTLQWLVVGRKLGGTSWKTGAGWIVGSAVGLVAGFFLGMIPMNMAGPDGPHAASLFALGFALNGVIPGVLQWLVLRRRAGWAIWWVVASSVGTLGCGMIYVRLTRASDVRLVLGAAAGGAFYGTLTGLVLACLLRDRSDASNPVSSAEVLTEPVKVINDHENENL